MYLIIYQLIYLPIYLMIVLIVFQEPTADDLSREEMYSMAEEMDQHLNTVSTSIHYIHSMI